MCRINPRVDFAFKKLFGSEENKDILIDFINSVVSEKDRVFDIEIKNPYNAKNFRDDKLSILDIKAVDSEGKWFNIEMQIIDQEYYAKRALYYWGRLYTEQLKTGFNYDKLKKTIGINILNFNCIEGEKEYHNVYKLKNTRTEHELLDEMEIHFIELEKYNETMVTILDRWVNFLKKAGLYEPGGMPWELENAPAIKKAMDTLNTMSFNDEEREIYEAGLKWMRDTEMGILTADKKGFERGVAEGKAEGERSSLLILLKAKFGDEAYSLEPEIKAITDSSILARLIAKAAEAKALQEFKKTLKMLE